MPSLSPELADRYEIHELLGEGGMGAVYRARHRELGLEVAVKLLKRISEQDVGRFRREAQILASLDHPQLVKVFDAGLDGDVPYLITELITWETLQERQRRAPLDARDAVAVVLQVAAALEFAHASGFIHRDVKPANVFVAGDLRTKLGDFGLARSVASGHTVTQAGHVVGTPEYMAPEQARGDALTPAADQFALGVMLYEMLARELPFHGAGPMQRMLARLQEDAPSLATRVPDLSPHLVRVVGRMLERDPARRFASIEELRGELDVFASCEPQTTRRMPSGRIPVPQAAGRPEPRPATQVAAFASAPATATATETAITEVPGTAPLPAAIAPTPRAAAWLTGLTLAVISMAAVLHLARPPATSPSPASGRPVAPVTPFEPPRPVAGFGMWRLVAPRVDQLRAPRKDAGRVVAEIRSQVHPFELGRDPRPWLYWHELGRWAEAPGGRPPPVSAHERETGAMLLESEFLQLGGLEAAGSSATLAGVAVDMVYQYPGDGRCWMALGAVLDREGLRDAAREVYAMGYRTRPKGAPRHWPTPCCEGLVRALRVLPGHDLEREWPEWIGLEAFSQNGWRGLRHALNFEDPALLLRMLEAGAASTVESTHPEKAREQIGRYIVELENDEPKARAVWEAAVGRPPTDGDSINDLIVYHRHRGDLAEAARYVAMTQPGDPQREVVAALAKDPAFADTVCVTGRGVLIPTLRIALYRRVEEGQLEAAKAGFAAQRDRLPFHQEEAALLWVPLLGAVGGESAELGMLRDRLCKPPLSWRLWSEATGTFVERTSARWMQETVELAGTWAHDGNLRLARALWHSRLRRWDASLSELTAALVARQPPTAPASLLVDVASRPLWAAALHAQVAGHVLEKARTLSLPPVRGWPASYVKAIAEYRNALAGNRMERVHDAARTLHDHEPTAPLWGQSMGWALRLSGKSVHALDWSDRFDAACRSNGQGLWAARELRNSPR